MHMMQLRYIPGYRSMAPPSPGRPLVLLQNGSIACCLPLAITVTNIGCSGLALHLAAELLRTESKEAAAGIGTADGRCILRPCGVLTHSGSVHYCLLLR